AAPRELRTLALHDALPIFAGSVTGTAGRACSRHHAVTPLCSSAVGPGGEPCTVLSGERLPDSQDQIGGDGAVLRHLHLGHAGEVPLAQNAVGNGVDPGEHRLPTGCDALDPGHGPLADPRRVHGAPDPGAVRTGYTDPGFHRVGSGHGRVGVHEAVAVVVVETGRAQVLGGIAQELPDLVGVGDTC